MKNPIAILAAARLGLNIEDINQVVSAAVGGINITQTVEGLENRLQPLALLDPARIQEIGRIDHVGLPEQVRMLRRDGLSRAGEPIRAAPTVHAGRRAHRHERKDPMTETAKKSEVITEYRTHESDLRVDETRGIYDVNTRVDLSAFDESTPQASQLDGAEVRRRVLIGTYVLSAGYYDAYYLKAQKVRTLIKRDFETVYADGIDAILTPAPGNITFPIMSRLCGPGIVVTEGQVRAAMRRAGYRTL